MNVKFETIVQNFRKIMQLNAVIILKRTKEYNRKIISKSGRKMDLYPALGIFYAFVTDKFSKSYDKFLIQLSVVVFNTKIY